MTQSKEMAESTVIVSPEWLHDHLDHPEVVIVDCRFSLADSQLGQQQYYASHIPGAYYLDLNRDLSCPMGKHGGRHPLPNPTALAEKLSDMGVSTETLVVGYDDSRFAFAARLWWLLRYLGHNRAAVLDGGFAAYQAAGYPVTTEMPVPRSGNFVPNLQLEQVVDIDAVKACKDLPDVVLVDSRERERYRGEHEPIDPIAGHIPGAANYPWQEVTKNNGFLRSPSELRSHWTEVEQAQEILVYCGSGVTACVNLLALEAAGIKTGKLYAGSWSDWCSYLV
jgi:thiosulfate/3-mercaptopyruvate sulfurtransferase